MTPANARNGFKWLAFKLGNEHANNGHEVTTVLRHCMRDAVRVHCTCGGSWDLDVSTLAKVEPMLLKAVTVLHPPECVKSEAGDCTCKAPDLP